jgi:hypothetical protein
MTGLDDARALRLCWSGGTEEVMERVRVEVHQGHRIIVVDGTDCGADEYAGILERGAAAVKREPPNSVLLATVVTRARFAGGAAERVKAYSAAIKPHVRKSAIVGLSAMQRVIYGAIRPFIHSTAKDFSTMAQAREWLVAGDDEAPPKPGP